MRLATIRLTTARKITVVHTAPSLNGNLSLDGLRQAQTRKSGVCVGSFAINRTKDFVDECRDSIVSIYANKLRSLFFIYIQVIQLYVFVSQLP